jgi:hypothetical protein
MYDPSLGRFLSRDPLGPAGGQADLYEYVGDAPPNATDPSGMAAPALPRPTAFLNQRIQEWLDQLGSADAVTVLRAIIRLNSYRQQVIRYLDRTLQPAVAPDPALVGTLIRDLGSDTFADRQRAAEKLEEIGPTARAQVQQALNARPGLELTRRLQQILERYDVMDRRTAALLEVLAPQPNENNPELSRLAQRLAGGAPSVLTALGRRLVFDILRANGNGKAAVVGQLTGLGLGGLGALGALPGVQEELER